LRQYSLYGICACLLVLAACGGPPPSDDRALEVATTSQALDVCTLSSLDWNGGTGTPTSDAQKRCSGPIYYETQCYEGKADPLCGVAGYGQKQCHKDYCDVEKYVRVKKDVSVYPVITKYDQKCEYSCSGGDCSVDCYPWNTYSYKNPCMAEVQKLIEAETDAAHRALVQASQNYPADYEASYWSVSGTCSITLDNVYKKERSSSPECQDPWEACDDTTKPSYGYCRDVSFGNASVDQCGTHLRRTEAGRSLQEARDEAAKDWKDTGYRSTTADFKTAPTCMTCEQETTVVGRFSCLDKSLALGNMTTTGADRVQLTRQVVSRMKLLFELEGEQLTEEQRTTARSLYKDFADHQLQCESGMGFTALATDSTCGDMASLNANLNLCSRLTASHVNLESAASSHSFCTNLLDAVTSVPTNSTCRGSEYRTAYASIMYKLVRRQATAISLDGSSSNPKLKVSDIRRALHAIDEWYAQGSLGLSGEAEFKNQLSRLLADFWTSAYATKVVYTKTLSASSTETEINTYLNDVGAKSLEVEREVLTQLFTDDAAGHLMKSESMLLVMGDGFKGLQERLTKLIVLHDFACRFKQCQLPADRSEMSLMWALLAAVHNPTLLNQAASERAPPVTKSLSDEASAWKDFFALMASNHSALELAMRDALLRKPGGDPSRWQTILANGASMEMPGSAAALSLIIQDAKSRTNSYEKTAFLTPDLRRILHSGISAAGRAELISTLESNNNLLLDTINTYKTGRHTLITSLQQELNGTTTSLRLLNQMNLRALSMSQLSQDLQGLRYSLSAQEARFSDFTSAFDALLESEKLEGGLLQYNRTNSDLPFTIKGTDSRFEPLLVGIQRVALKDKSQSTGVAPWKLTVNPGDLINFHTTGSWSPSCALSKANTIADETALPAAVEVERSTGPTMAPITTGPEGYSVQWSNSVYQARSNSSTNEAGFFYNETSSTQACEGAQLSVSAGLPPSVPSPVQFSLGYSSSVQKCEANSRGKQGSQTYSNSSTSGSDTRSSASFSRGLRLSNTPLPALPVGSLVLVEMPQGITDPLYAKDIHVIQSGADSFIPRGPGSSELYLVVNDASNCTTPPSSVNSLTVRINRLEPINGRRSQVLKDTMLQTLTKIRLKESEILAQGRMLPGDKTTLRVDALAALGSLTAEPLELRQLFEAWIDKEIAILEKKAEILNVERAMGQLVLEMNGLNQEINNAEMSSRLYRLSTTWALRDVDSRQLRDAGDIANIAIKKMVEDFFPVLELRYPSVLRQLSNKDAPYYLNQLNAIIDTKLSDSVLTQVSNTHTAMRAIVLAYKNQSSDSLIKPPFFVTLRFKRPTATALPSTWRLADDVMRAQALWHAVDTGGTFSLHLTPWDLYTNPTRAAQLGCSEASAVIEAVGLHFNWYHPWATNLNGLRLDTEFDDQQLFVTEQGPVSYSLVNDPPQSPGGSTPVNPWRRQIMPMTSWASYSKAEDFFNSYSLPMRVGEGLSPFTKMSINFKSLYDSLHEQTPPLNMDEADEMAVIFKLTPRAAGNVKWPGVCN
jgi:hypothetical protein